MTTESTGPAERVQRHHLLGMVLFDLFRGSAWSVDVERDLSVQQQRLDLLILRRGTGPEPDVWPGGLDGPAQHFLITFKSAHQALDIDAVRELVGHLVAYRKLTSPRPSDLLPSRLFQMVAVAMRFPEGLVRAVGAENLVEVRPGVYDLMNAVAPVRVLVTREIPPAEADVLWNLFSNMPEQIRFAYRQLRPRLPNLPTTLNALFELAELEGEPMSLTYEDLVRETEEQVVASLRPDQVAKLTPRQLAGLTSEQLAGLSPEQLAGLTPAQLTSLRPEQLAMLPPEKRLAGLTPEQLRAYLRSIDPQAEPG